MAGWSFLGPICGHEEMLKREVGRIAAGLIAAALVFGLAVLMIIERYDPAVITTVVTGTSLAAAELVHRLQSPTSLPSAPDGAPPAVSDNSPQVRR